MAACNYNDKRFLIVDSLKPSRDVLKSLAFSLAPSVVHASSYANDVINKCSEQSYDIILLGYDLGDRQKNGQQLLEELRAMGLVNRNTVIILVTGEMSQAMVLAALEHKPDDYLTKPYTIGELSKRLHRCFTKKERMHDIYAALDKKNAELAISLCDIAINENTPYRTECLGIKSRQYFELGLYDQASQIYLAHQNTANCQWATMGLGRIELKKNNPREALKHFSVVKQKYPIYLSSYDWIATTYEELLQFIKAEETLEQAITISPLSVKRVKRYADLCLKNGHFGKATTAFEQNYNLSFNSIHHRADNALQYAYAASEYSEELADLPLKVLKNKVVAALNETVKTFDDLPTRIQSQLISVDWMRKTKDTYLAERLLNSTENLITKTQHKLNSKDGLQIAKLLIQLGRRPPANVLLNTIVENNHNALSVMTEVDKLIDEQHENKIQKAAQAALDNALILYQKKAYGASIAKLEHARKLYPKHLGITLNLIQVLLSEYEENDQQKISLQKAGSLLNTLTHLSAGNNGFQRQQALEKKFQRLQIALKHSK